MTKKFWRTVYKILYIWMGVAFVLISSMIWVLLKEGEEKFRSVWYGKTLLIANGIWVALVIVFLFSVHGIKAHYEDKIVKGG